MSKPLAHVLAVEDQPDFGGLLKAVLARYRIDTTVVTSGEAALLALATPAYDLILLDIALPGINGLETCRRIKARPELESIPVVFISGQGSQANRDEASRLGAVEFIAKPFDLLPFITCILGHLKLAAIPDEDQQRLQPGAQS